MNRISWILAFALMVPAGATFAQTKAGALSPYEQAVKSYVDAAHAEMEAFREQIEGETKDQSSEVVARYEPVMRRMAEAEQAFKDLQRARQPDFDQRKLAYERARESLVKALEKARKG
jgi:hypothetical protein